MAECTTAEITFWSFVGIVLIVLVIIGVRELCRGGRRGGRGGDESSSCARNLTARDATRKHKERASGVTLKDAFAPSTGVKTAKNTYPANKGKLFYSPGWGLNKHDWLDYDQ